MAIELGTDNIVESVENSSVLTRPELETTATTGRDMCQDMHSFVVLFCLQKCVVEPLLCRVS